MEKVSKMEVVQAYKINDALDIHSTATLKQPSNNANIYHSPELVQNHNQKGHQPNHTHNHQTVHQTQSQTGRLTLIIRYSEYLIRGGEGSFSSGFGGGGVYVDYGEGGEDHRDNDCLTLDRD
jgi:hypothetical protein